MSDPEITNRRLPRTVSWAERVTKEDRHGPADLENVLLVNDRRNVRRLHQRLKGGMRFRLWPGLVLLMATTPLAAPVVFTSGRWWGTTREYNPSWAYPTAAIVCCVGFGVLGIFLKRWCQQRVRLRDSMATKFAVTYVVSTGLALFASHRLAHTFDGSIALYVAPMWILLLLSMLTVIYQAKSPANPAWDHLTGSRQRIDVRRIHDEDRAWLLEERDQALRVLAERGLLDDESLEELAARPLGELHLPTEAPHDQRR